MIETTHDKLLSALDQFDRNLRDTAEWVGWEKRQTHKYAIAHNGLKYPVKEIITMATKQPKAEFGGGDQANNYVKKYGFEVVPLHRIASRNVWWVNQGQTYERERDGGYLWAPIRNKRGGTEIHWETMAEVRENDLIVHYCQGQVRA